MALVDYESSEPASSSDGEETQQPRKKQKRGPSHGEKPSNLPPLPSIFQDLYSSTVRSSTQDDPSLHAGRTRVTPHVEGSWPTHVYLDWRPRHHEAEHLSKIVEAVQSRASDHETVTSLLRTDLDVSLPLHVSLSRPLALLTEQREPFLKDLKQAVAQSGVAPFTVQLGEVVWHPNESSTRWFLVQRLQESSSDELGKLLLACNGASASFGQPSLYTSQETSADESSTANRLDRPDDHPNNLPSSGQFHISLAWSLVPQSSEAKTLPSALEQDTSFEISFDKVKVRVGQDVHNIPLASRRFPTCGHTSET
ncbi:hypothetical protein K431DRAFT_319102 [Polychaeton citri CBS 116435]|uniref:U6 snRNA phosphodiesterase n=1 Tax=Polychaeton citri CBS 116435 TaxID=1314669 RepID=A0A9P4Q9W3_9PEZI|nr:hypothetical protein K431DRAFT_319102 [Polychaeton citri CBS 116435]